jgi:hypothetical protein
MTAADPPIVADGHTHIFNRVYWAHRSTVFRYDPVLPAGLRTIQVMAALRAGSGVAGAGRR